MSIDISALLSGVETPSVATGVLQGGIEKPAETYLLRRLSNPNRTVIEATWGQAVLTDNARTVCLTGRSGSGGAFLERTLVQLDRYSSDTFSRTRPSTGWGLSEGGTGTWNHTGGSDPANYSVTPGFGQIYVDTALVTRHAFLGSYNWTSQKMMVLVKSSRTSVASGGLSYGLVMCRVDNNNHYRLHIRVGTTGSVYARITLNNAGTISQLTEVQLVGLVATDSIWIKGEVSSSGVIDMYAWKDGQTPPVSPTVTTTNTSFSTDGGRMGLFASHNSAEGTTPATYSFSNFTAEGTVVNPTTVVTRSRVYMLPSPHDPNGPIDLPWLAVRAKSSAPEDMYDIFMQFMPGAAAQFDEHGVKVRGDSHYGPLGSDPATFDGSRIEGSDFNDYMGVDWDYGSGGIDTNEESQLGALDCSGFVRMVYGPMGLGLGLLHSSVTVGDGVNLTKVSYSQMATTSLGVELIPNVPDTTPSPTDIANLQPGDVVGFDADSGEATSGQIDHVGIYIGLSTEGDPLFVSSRKTPDGPSFSKTGGASSLSGSGLYATRFRVARRF